MDDQNHTQTIVVSDESLDPNMMVQRTAFFNADGTPLNLDDQTGAEVILTGYSAESAAAVAATDTANEAIAKLEARIVALEMA